MIQCLRCQSSYDTLESPCPHCKSSPETIDGIYTFAPEFLHEGGGFKAEFFARLVSLEATNFWFRSRNSLILTMLKKYAASLTSFLEIGCGTGYVLSAVSNAFPNAKTYGSEIFIAGLPYAAQRTPHAQFFQMDARKIPFQHEFDVIGAFDVLEHIKEDEIVLAQMHDALKKSGLLIVTIPQHMWLWSAADENACHERRYSARDIESKVIAAGFEIIKSTSFVTTLLPAMFLSRMTQRRYDPKTFDPTAEFNIPTWMNRTFEMLLRIEIFLISIGITFPIGGSRLVVARKK